MIINGSSLVAHCNAAFGHHSLGISPPHKLEDSNLMDRAIFSILITPKGHQVSYNID